MFEFFSQILGFIQSLFSIVVNLFSSLITLFVALNAGSSSMGVVLAFFPAVISASVTAVVAVSIIKLVVGR